MNQVNQHKFCEELNKNINCTQYVLEISELKQEENESQSMQLCLAMDDIERKLIFQKNVRKLKQIKPYVYDNMHVFSFNKNAIHKKEIKPSNHQIALIKVASNDNDNNNNNNFYDLWKNKANPKIQEHGLNIINRERFEQSGYIRLNIKKDIFYDRSGNNNNNDIIHISQNNFVDEKYPDLIILKGYQSSAHFSINSCLIKTCLRFKAISNATMHDFIHNLGLDKCKKLFLNKNTIATYDSNVIKIFDFDTNKSLDCEFEKSDGTFISFRDYYTKT